MIRPVDTRQDIEGFIDIAVELARSRPGAIPPFRASERAYFDAGSNYFLRIGGQFRAFSAFREDGSAAGRIAAMVHPEMPGTGLLGLFECTDDTKVAQELLDTGISWLREAGCTRVIGPVNFSIYRDYRFMTSGFTERPFPGEPRNPSYYPKLFLDHGFSEFHRWESLELDKASIDRFRSANRGHAELFTQLGYRSIRLDDSNQEELMHRVYHTLQASYRVFPLFTSISEPDFMREFAHMPRIMVRECSHFVFDPDGVFLGFLIVLKDLSKALAAMKGRTGLLAKLRFLRYRNDSEIASIVQGATTPFFIRQAAVLGRKHGGKPLSLAAAVSCLSLDDIVRSGRYSSALFSLMRCDGHINNHIRAWSGKREYALYQYLID